MFAPNDLAFSLLGQNALDDLLSGDAEEVLSKLLLFHVIENDVLYANDLECAETIQMVNGAYSRTVCRDGKVYQKGANNPRDDLPRIIETDLEASNGVIHVLERVMLPPQVFYASEPNTSADCQSVCKFSFYFLIVSLVSSHRANLQHIVFAQRPIPHNSTGPQPK